MAMIAAAVPDRADELWLARFHAGERAVLESVYVEQFAGVAAAIAPIVGPTERETIIHDVFASLIAHREVRESFRGGSLGAWLRTVARNRALDHVRRMQRERLVLSALDDAEPRVEPDVAAAARRELAAFRATLPTDWIGVFDACFVRQLSQRDAARALAIPRTTIAYRALRIRRALRRFILEDVRRDD